MSYKSVHIGQKIKALREANGDSQADFARKLGLNRGTIAKMEGGDQRVYWDIMVDIATICDVSLDDLAGKKKGVNSNTNFATEPAAEYGKSEFHQLLREIIEEHDFPKKKSAGDRLASIYESLRVEVDNLKDELLSILRKATKL